MKTMETKTRYGPPSCTSAQK